MNEQDLNRNWNNAFEKIVAIILIVIPAYFIWHFFSGASFLAAMQRQPLQFVYHLSLAIGAVGLLFSRKWGYYTVLLFLYSILSSIVFYLFFGWITNGSDLPAPVIILVFLNLFLFLVPFLLIGLLATKTTREKYGLKSRTQWQLFLAGIALGLAFYFLG